MSTKFETHKSTRQAKAVTIARKQLRSAKYAVVTEPRKFDAEAAYKASQGRA